ncbi:protein LTO1 homolog [Ipomoea triloba]|uniref:protein LTO1 homolog n=1 Tax=Ipomoea triloba TaxID=35885 RepID=UPI00125E57C3|nr:protein LTO1 homolog [Ipomoea triloba]
MEEDIFDSSLNLEDTHYKQGYSDGYADGQASGVEEGRQVGLKTGFEVGFELGFYRGCIDAWNSAILLDPTCFSPRVQKNIAQMDELIRKYPIADPENESVTDIMDSLRMKFRAICATLNVKLEYEGYPRASGVENTGF